MRCRKIRRLLSLDVIFEEGPFTTPGSRLEKNLIPQDPIDTEAKYKKIPETSENERSDLLATNPAQEISWENERFVSRSQILRKTLQDLQKLLESCNARLGNTTMKRQYGSSLALHKINDLSQGNVTRSLRMVFEPSSHPEGTSTLPTRGRSQHKRLERTSSANEYNDLRRCNSVYKLAPAASYEAPEMRRSTSMVSMFASNELQTIPEVPVSRIPVKVPPQTMPKPCRTHVMDPALLSPISPVAPHFTKTEAWNQASSRDYLLRDIRTHSAPKTLSERSTSLVEQAPPVKTAKPSKVMVDKQTQTLSDKETQTTDLEAVDPPCENFSVRQISQVFSGSPKPVKQEILERKVSQSEVLERKVSQPETHARKMFQPEAQERKISQPEIQERKIPQAPAPAPVTPEPLATTESTETVTVEELPKKDTVKNARSVFENAAPGQPLVFDVYGTLKRSSKAGSPQYNPISRSPTSEAPCVNRQSVVRANSAPVNSTAYKTPIHWPTFKETSQMVEKTTRTGWKNVSPRDGLSSNRSCDLESFCSEEISDGASDIDSELSFNSRNDSFYDRNDTEYRYIPQDVLERIRSYGMTMTFFGGKVSIDNHCTDDDDDDADNFSLIEEEITKKQPVSRTHSAQSPRIIGCIPKDTDIGRKRHSSGESASSGVSSGNPCSDRDSPQNSPFTSLRRSPKEEKGKKLKGQSVVFNFKKSFMI